MAEGHNARDIRMSVMRKVLLSDLYYELDHEEKRFVRYGAGQIPEKKKKKKPGHPENNGIGSGEKAQGSSGTGKARRGTGEGKEARKKGKEAGKEARRKGKEARGGRSDKATNKSQGNRTRN